MYPINNRHEVSTRSFFFTADVVMNFARIAGNGRAYPVGSGLFCGVCGPVMGCSSTDRAALLSR